LPETQDVQVKEAGQEGPQGSAEQLTFAATAVSRGEVANQDQTQCEELGHHASSTSQEEPQSTTRVPVEAPVRQSEQRKRRKSWKKGMRRRGKAIQASRGQDRRRGSRERLSLMKRMAVRRPRRETRSERSARKTEQSRQAPELSQPSLRTCDVHTEHAPEADGATAKAGDADPVDTDDIVSVDSDELWAGGQAEGEAGLRGLRHR